MTELLPCPFCGGEATVERMGHNGYYFVACAGLNCCDSALADTEAEAITAWNTRAERTCKNVNEWRDENYVLHRDARIFKCSECGFKADDFYGDDEQSFPNYCPNCGAKVVGE